MSLIQKITEDVKTAQKAGDAPRLLTLRGALAQIHNKKIELGRELNESEEEQVLQKELKKRKEAILLFEQGGRADLAGKEKIESEILSLYLPPALSPEEMELAVKEVISAGEREFGKIMKASQEKLGNRADGKELSLLVKKILAG